MVMRSVRQLGQEFLARVHIDGVVRMLKIIATDHSKPFDMFAVCCAAVYALEEEADRRLAYEMGAANFIYTSLPRFARDAQAVENFPIFYSIALGALFHTYGTFVHVSVHQDFTEVADDDMFRMIIQELVPMTPSPSSAHYNSLRIMVTRAKRIANRSCVSEVIKYISALVVAAETDENVQYYGLTALAVIAGATRGRPNVKELRTQIVPLAALVVYRHTTVEILTYTEDKFEAWQWATAIVNDPRMQGPD